MEIATFFLCEIQEVEVAHQMTLFYALNEREQQRSEYKFKWLLNEK